MKELVLRSIVVKKFNHSWKLKIDDTKEYPNLLEQNFYAEKPSQWEILLTFIQKKQDGPI